MKFNFFLFILFISFSSFSQVAEKPEDISPLLIGEKVPDTEITTVENIKIPLTEIVKEKPSILLFYRGGWCPYCNAHLSAVGEVTEEINKMGYQIVAVSPDSPEKLTESLQEQDLDYKLFSDADGSLIKAMGLAHKAPEKYGSMLSSFSNGANTGFLPAPALFIVNTEGEIIFEYISPDYKQRISSKMLMAVLDALQE